MARSVGWTRSRIDALLRAAARDLDTTRLSHSQFRRWADDQDVAVPSITTVIDRYGSWQDACRAVGLDVNKRRYGDGQVSPSQRITVEDCRAAVRDFIRVCAEQGQKPSVLVYQGMYKTYGWPAHGTIRARLDGGWANIIASRGGVPSTSSRDARISRSA